LRIRSSHEIDHGVVIAGGGPTGLMLAGELALAGVDVVIVEPRTSQQVDGSRAGGLHARTIEVLDQRGIAERFVAAGERHPSVGYAGIQLDITDFPTRHNYVLGLWQSHFEPILADWVTSELGVPILGGRAVAGFAQDATGVDVEMSDGRTLRCAYLVGCDGGRSLVRKAARIDFVGTDASTSWLIAEVDMDGQPEFGIRYDPAGIQAIGPTGDGTSVRVVLIEPSTGSGGEPTLDELRELLVAVYGTDFGLRRARWISRFTDMARQATSYRDGRVLLAGDAAHVHGPMGGQGLNTGVQDAVNLGWKLARVVHGTSPDRLLDTYHSERHPVGARVLDNTLAQVALGRGDDRHLALRSAMTELLGMDEPRRRIAGMISGLDVHYDVATSDGNDGHPVLGRRMPDLDVHTELGHTRAYELLHDARPILLNLTPDAAVPTWPRADRVKVIDATCSDIWELPVIGHVPAPPAVLIRPDGYVAWTGDLSDSGTLTAALTTWFEPLASTN
jgi:3-(3-hydroxy-phenyl)propionate hydroxylase